MSDQVYAVDEADDFHNLTSNLHGKVRGEDVADIQQKCLSLCQKYLSGIWSELTVNDIEVKRLTGGLSNIIYQCKVVDSKAKDSNETHEVVIRFYGEKFVWSVSTAPDDDRLSDAVVGLLASEKGLGAHIYGVFKEGQIQKYYPHRLFAEVDLNDPGLLQQLASKLARFHAIKAPMPKDNDLVRSMLTSSAKKLKESPQKWEKLFEKYEFKSLLDCDMSSEVKWLLELIPSFESPIVFSHLDFRFANQMISNENEVILADFEFSSCYFRGFDFATLFENTDPNKEVIKVFITEYLKEGHKIFGKTYSEDVINSVEHLLKEMKQFSLGYSLMMANVFLHNEIWKFPFNEKECMSISKTIMDRYLATKKLLIESKII